MLKSGDSETSAALKYFEQTVAMRAADSVWVTIGDAAPDPIVVAQATGARRP